MSLRVWLPLNGDLQNKGLDQIEITTDTGTYQTGGKIGQKAIDMSGHVKFKAPSLVRKNVFSISFWYKPIYNASSTVNWNKILVFETLKPGQGAVSGAIFRFETSYGLTNDGYAISIHNNVGQEIASIGTYLASGWDTWQNIIATADGERLQIYRDGQLITKAKMNGGVLNGQVHIGYINPRPQGLMNDLRLYDHTLSLKQIKEISRGLVLHYPLDGDNIKGPNSNLLLNSSLRQNFTNWFFSGKTDSDGIVEKDGYLCAHVTGALQTTKYLNPKYTTLANSATSFKPYKGLKLTLSADILLENVVKGTTNYWLALYKSGTTINGTWTTPTSIGASDYLRYDGRCEPELLNGKGWVHVYISFYFSEDYDWENGSNIAPMFYARDFTGDFYIKNAKLEFGYQATPWIPNVNDTEYTSLGYNDNTIYDCSGYQNNGVPSNINYSTNTSKYLSSAYFNGTDSSILTPQGSFSWFNFDQCTIAAWMSPEVNPSRYSGSIGIAHNFTTGHKCFVISNYSGKFSVLTTNGTTYVNTVSSLDLPIGEWHYCAATLDGTTMKMYFDGQLIKTVTLDWGTAEIASDTRVQVGVDLPGTDERYNGYYSDVRIYMTTLSEEDIKQLYRVRATGDRDANYFTSGKYIEENNIAKVQHNGNSNYNEFKEKNHDIKSVQKSNIINIEDGANNVPMESVVAHIEPVQNLHGYDNPWPAGGGINKLPSTESSDTTVSGVRFKSDGNGAFSINGTAGANCFFTFALKQAITLPSSAIYVHLMNPVSNANVSVFFHNGTTQVAGITLGAVNRIYNLTALSGATVDAIRIIIVSGEMVDITFTPMLCLDNVAKPFSPYSNICQIGGWTQAKVTRTGKNLFNRSTSLSAKFINSSGEVIGTTGWSASDYIEIKDSCTYTLSGYAPTGTAAHHAFYDANKNFISSIQSVGNNTFVSPSGSYYVRLSIRSLEPDDAQLEIGPTATTYEIYKPIVTATIDLDGTVYGGYVDAVIGKLVVDRVLETLDGSQPVSDNGTQAYGGIQIKYMPSQEKKYASDQQHQNEGIISDKFDSSEAMPSTAYKVTGRSTSGNIFFNMPPDITTAQEARTWLGNNPTQISYLLATPIEYDLTPQEITSLLGVNNIWADTGDIEITYSMNSNKIQINREKTIFSNSFYES